MKEARDRLRQALGPNDGPGKEQPRGSSGKRSSKGDRDEDAQTVTVTMSGDKPQTFVVKGDLYIYYERETGT